MPPDNTWQEWSKYVLKQLEENNETQKEMSKSIIKIKEEIIRLKMKAGIWGMFGASLPIALLIILEFLRGK